MKFLVMTMVFGMLTAVSAQAADQKASAYVLCKNQKNVRTIKILPEKMTEPAEPQPGLLGDAKTAVKTINGCAVSYSKGGVDEKVGSNRSLDTCKSILKSIQYNLETSKWSCRNVQTAVVTTSKESITQ